MNFRFIILSFAFIALINSQIQDQTPKQCLECVATMTIVQQVSKKYVLPELNSFTDKLCHKFLYSQEVCDGIFKTFTIDLINQLFIKKVSPKDACSALYQCGNPSNNNDATLEQFIEEYLNSAKPYAKKSNLRPATGKKIKVLHLADVHVDADYEVGSVGDCGAPLCCRSNSTPSKGKNSTQQAGFWGTLANCDIPYRTLESALQQIAQLQPDLVFWTGDTISHDIWAQNADNQTDPTRRVTELLKQYLPNAQFLPIFGNHECFPADQCDVVDDSDKDLFTKVSQYWSSWLTQKQQNSLSQHGFYSSYIQSLNSKVLVLNTQVCDVVNFFLIQNPNDPDKLLEWMHDEMLQAELGGEGVILMAHIPPADDTCSSQWALRHHVLVERFQHIIRGQFYGHTHQDQIQIDRSVIDNRPLALEFIAPSLTTYSFQNPSFRLLQFDDNGEFDDYFQYRLDLNKANSQNDTTFELAYSFKQFLNVSTIDIEDIDSKFNNIQQDIQFLKEYINNFWAAGPLSEADIQQLDLKFKRLQILRFYRCKTISPTGDSYGKCMGLELKKDATRIGYEFLEYLAGKWYD